MKRPYLLVVVLGPGHLVVVDGDPCDLSTAGGCNGAHGAADATAHIQALFARPQLQQRCEARLVRGLRRRPVLSGEPRGEVEALQAGAQLHSMGKPFTASF